MDFEENEDHRAIRLAVRDVCKQFDDDYWMGCELEHRFPWDFYSAMAQGGWIGIAIPEAYGGGGQGITEASIVLEEVAASGARNLSTWMRHEFVAITECWPPSGPGG
jgi:acyl-CoA dehydrogenase